MQPEFRTYEWQPLEQQSCGKFDAKLPKCQICPASKIQGSEAVRNNQSRWLAIYEAQL